MPSRRKKTVEDDIVMSFSAVVDSVRTTTDGGIRIALDISEDLTDIARQFMDARRLNSVVKIAAIIVLEE